MTKNTIHEYIGWVGVCCILVAYIGISYQFLSPQSMVYQVLNIVGATGIIYDAVKQKNYQPVVLNIVWATVAIVSIIKSIIS